MSFDADEEILQDFLIEAGEILEQLSEQLVALENEPEDMDLLNAIFRGFHTVKGGAGFLNLTPLVEICHVTENIFDILRNGERKANAELMDVILQALDVINEMFANVQDGQWPNDADPQLLEKLSYYAKPASEDEVPEEPAEPEAEPAPSEVVSSEPNATATDEITDDEFEALLDELHGKGQFKGAPAVDSVDANTPSATEAKASADDITDEEFEALLDELHGKGQFKGVPEPKSKDSQPTQTADNKSGDSDLIDEDEFEALLDELHGKGKGPGAKSTEKSSPANEVAEKAPKPEPAPAPKPAADTAKKKTKTEDKKPAAVAKPQAARKPATPPVTEATVRVDTKRLDDIMNMVGELVLARNRLKTLSGDSHNEELAKAVATLDLVTGDLQGAVMKTRMQPIKKVFGRFPRVVRDLARSLKKEISLEMSGEDTDLDKNLVEALADPLVHLVRNSVDHGIESPEERVKAGKPRTGRILLSAAQEGDHIMLAIEDDGKGMDAEMLRKKAIEKGLMDTEQAARLTDEECYNLIFMAGFSTKEQISDISGRGVGMDVVKTKITQLNGSLSIQSELGKGTKISIKVPLTLAILPTLMVMVGEQAFALPLTAVNEIFHLDLTKTNVVDGQLMIVVREKALPLFFLKEWLTRDYNGERQEEGHVVLVQVGTQRVGFVVDSLIGQEEVVIKPLGKSLQGTPGMAGATITSDGGIALIIDIPSLLKHYASR